MATKYSLFPAIIFGYVFWTSFSALPPMIWFYPLNELDITGYEAFVLVLFLPIILKLKFLLAFFHSKFGDALLHLSIIFTLLSFQAPDTFWRLCVIAIGASLSVFKFACDLSQPNVSAKFTALLGYTGGYLTVLVTRIMYRTITPTFNDVYTNVAVVSVAIATFLHFDNKNKQKYNETRSKNSEQKSIVHSGAWSVGLGLGSVIYVILAVFGEISVPCRWTVAPYPNTGPLPTPWGLWILFCLIIGLFLSKINRLVFNPIWSLLGLVSYVVMYKLDGYQGFLGACLLAVFVMSVWPNYATLYANCKEPALPLFLAMWTYLLPAFYSVWTVAYNFVPLGVYTREFTGLNIAFSMFFISLGLFLHRNYKFPAKTTLEKSQSWQFAKFVVVLFGIASASMFYRYQNWKPGDRVTTNERNDITAMIWTYHFGYDNQGWPSLDRTEKLVRDINADVIGLLETDASRLYMGNNDLAAWLAEKLNMYVDYGPGTKKHTWGSMLLSKFPIVSSEHHLLPSPEGELAPAVSAVLDVRGRRVGVVVTHMGNDRDDLDRKQQTLALSNITSTFVERDGLPVIFLGYVTSKPYERDYKVFTSKGRLNDIDPTDKSRFCEYIYYQGLIRLAYARISKGRLSDTEIQTAKFRVPEKGAKYEDHTTLTTDVSEVPTEQRYSPTFGEFLVGHNYANDHKFHMSTPKHFLPARRQS